MKLLTNLGKGSHTRSKRQTWDLLQKSQWMEQLSEIHGQESIA